MVEALKVKSLAYRQRWGEAAEPMKLIERSKILVENLQIRDVIKQQDDCARQCVRERLNALYADHAERGMIRSGATLRDGICVFEEEAARLVDNLVREVLALVRNAGAFALVLEGVEQFLALLDGELARIVKKVEYENQDTGSSHGIARAAQNLWTEKRAGVLERLERHRWEFLMPAPEPSEADTQRQEEDEGEGAAPESEAGPAEPGDTRSPATMEPAGPAEDTDETPPAEEQDDASGNEDDAANGDAGHGEDDAEVADAAPEPDRADAAGHWHEMWAETALKLWTGKLQPKTLAQLREAMADLSARQGIAPDEAEIGDCARLLWTKYAATQRITASIAPGTDDLTPSGFDWQTDSSGVGACRVSGRTDSDRSDADHQEAAAAIASGALRQIDLTAPALTLD